MFQDFGHFWWLVVILQSIAYKESKSKCSKKSKNKTNRKLHELLKKMITTPNQARVHPGSPSSQSRQNHRHSRPRAVVSVHSHHRCNMTQRPTRPLVSVVVGHGWGARFWWCFGPVNFRQLRNLGFHGNYVFLEIDQSVLEASFSCTGWSLVFWGPPKMGVFSHWQITVTMSTKLEKYADSIKFRQAGPALAAPSFCWIVMIDHPWFHPISKSKGVLVDSFV